MSIGKKTFEALSEATIELTKACQTYREIADKNVAQAGEGRSLKIRYQALLNYSKQLTKLIADQDIYLAMLLDSDALEPSKFKDNEYKSERLEEYLRAETLIEDLVSKIESFS